MWLSAEEYDQFLEWKRAQGVGTNQTAARACIYFVVTNNVKID